MEEIHDIHDKILHSVVGLLKEGRDPLQVAGCLLAGAVQLYQLELGDDQTTDFIELARDCLSTLSKVSIVEKIKQLRLKIREMESNDENTNVLMKKIVKLEKQLND